MRDFKKDPLTREEVEEFLRKNPALVVAAGMAMLQILSRSSERPAWLKDCAPVHSRTAGPWRGKGSFGHGFGPVKVTHK